jgi:hypothetical protein
LQSGKFAARLAAKIVKRHGIKFLLNLSSVYFKKPLYVSIDETSNGRNLTKRLQFAIIKEVIVVEESLYRKENYPKLIVISGPSGVGKDTIARNLIDTNPDQFYFVVTATTRPTPCQRNTRCQITFSTARMNLPK